MSYSSYYQAYVEKNFCWYVVAILKSFDHLAFDRTLDTPTNLFEFYVTPGKEQEFETLMNYFEKNNYIRDFKKLPNRLMDQSQQL